MKSKLRFGALLAASACMLFASCSKDDNWNELPFTNDVLSKITDPVFHDYCQSQMGEWDTDGDGKLSQEEAAEVTIIDVGISSSYYDYSYETEGVKSLAGIEYFTKLTGLNCEANQLSTLDVSKNTALIILQCDGNQLTTLDLSNNTALTILSCHNNQLTALDLSNNTALSYVYCSANQLTELDVSNNTALTQLVCEVNQLTTLNLSDNTALTDLYCTSNQLSVLNVSNNTALDDLYCSNNQLALLDISNNTELTVLECSYNKLTALDISNNTALFYLNCNGNPGNGTTFPIRAWFDNSNIPVNFQLLHTKRAFWDYNGATITVDYHM